MENLTFQYPTWYLLFCLLLGLVFSALLYYWDRTFREQLAILNGVLGLVRFLAISLLAMLLLTPLLRRLTTDQQDPIVLLLQDESESIANGLTVDSSTYRQGLENLQVELSNNYEVKTYGFGRDLLEEPNFSFQEKSTNLSKAFRSLNDLYSNQNVGAIILASDGVFNEGSNPLYLNLDLNAPIHTIALGDTVPSRDLVLKRVFHNKIAYLGDRFGIQIDVAAQNCSGETAELAIFAVENGNTRKLQSKRISLNEDLFFTTESVLLEANKPGVQRFRIQLSSLDGEVSTVNNRQDIFVDVLDARQQVLILAAAPHPDLSAMKQALESNQNYEVALEYVEDRSVDLKTVDFAILHQLPSASNNIAPLLQQLDNNKTPRLFVIGSQTDLTQLNSAQEILTIQGDGRNTNQVQASVFGGFNLFTLSDELRADLGKFPPLVAPFGEFRVNGNAQTLFRQRVGRVDTDYPLFLLGEENGTKVGLLAAEGIWKWRLFNYLQYENHDLFNEVVRKSVQYLSVKEDKRRFRVNLAKNIYKENEAIIFDAELYNESFERVNTPDAGLSIKDEEGRVFNLTFNRRGDSYRLNANTFPVGSYTFTGTTSLSGKALTYNGQFSVEPVQLELYETTANHGLLQSLSAQSNGQVFYPGQETNLSQLLTTENKLKPILYQSFKTQSVINFKWIFFLLLGLLTIEWVTRRYFGAY